MEPILSQPELHKDETPTRVIRPPNAYLLFNREMRKRLKNNNPGMTVGEISKEIGVRWKSLSQVKYFYFLFYLHPLTLFIVFQSRRIKVVM
jgi:hypothetical protein